MAMPEPSPTPISKLLAEREKVCAASGTSSASDLAMILTGMHMPPSLKGGLRILSQACKLLRRACAALPAQKRQALRAQMQEIRWVVRNAKSLAQSIFDSDKERYSFLRCTKSNPYRSEGAHDHGLCSLLWEIDRTHRRQFDVVRQSALLVHLAVLDYWAARPEWCDKQGPKSTILESIYRRTLAMRHFVMKPYRSEKRYGAALGRVPAAGSHGQIKRAILGMRQALNPEAGGLESNLFRDLAAIASFLKLGDDPSSIRAYTDDDSNDLDDEQDQSTDDDGNTKKPYRVECTDRDGIEEDDESYIEHESSGQLERDYHDEAIGVSYRRERWTKAELDLCMDLGLCPSDILPTQHLHLSTRRSGDMRSSQATRNQNLSLACRNLATQELARGLRILEKDADRSTYGLELLIRVKTTLARGLTLDKLERLEVRSDRPEKVSVLTLIMPSGDYGFSEWVVPALPLKFAKEHGDYPGCRRTKQDFPTPDFWAIAILMRRLIERRFPEWKGEPLRPFAAPGKGTKRQNCSKNLKLALHRLDQNWGPGLSRRFTFPRLARALPQKMFDQTAGDRVLATYATMQRDLAGEDGRFYATPAVLNVQNAERAAVTAIAYKLQSAGYDPGVDLTVQPSDSSGYLGSPMCPTLEAIEAFFTKLVQAIADANAILLVREDRDAYIARHNAFAMLTFCVESIGTCQRPSHEGVPDLPEIDPSSGLMSIVDKGLARARLGLIADAAFVQRKAYNDYIYQFDFEKHLGVQSTGSLFFLEPSGTVVSVTHSSLNRHGLPFVPNIARHLVKTILSEWCAAGDKRVCQEWISALLGHFMEGEESFGRHSTFPYREFADCMRQALNDLLASFQFRPMNVSGRKITVHAPHIRRFLDSGKA